MFVRAIDLERRWRREVSAMTDNQKREATTEESSVDEKEVQG